MKTSRKLWVSVIAGLVLVVAVLVGVKTLQIVTMVRGAEQQKPPPMAVSSATAQVAEWAPTRGAVATLVAARGVTLTAELPGRVTDIAFESGASVRKGT
ncbi:MAG TPA: efflux transporter periplasmic adaptor subunit, partial [Anaeromyxobacter sp.]